MRHPRDFKRPDLSPSAPRFPGQALLVSIILHVALVLFPIWEVNLLFPNDVASIDRPAEPVPTKLQILVFRGHSSGSSGMGGGAAKRQPESSGGSSAPLKTPKGIIYPGPQLFVAEATNPDNAIQVIRQPDLLKPPRIKVPIVAPNIILNARAFPLDIRSPKSPPTPPANPIVIAQNVPLLRPPPAPEIEAPKLILPPSGEDALKNIQKSDSKLLAEKVVPPPPAPVTGTGTDARNLLIITAASPQVAPPSSVPAGESSAAFTVAPDAANTHGGSRGSVDGGAGTSSLPPGSGLGLGTRGLAPDSSGAGGGSGSGAGGRGSKPGGGAAGGNGKGNGGQGTGGTGNSGNGNGATGAHVGMGAGSGPFQGISIGGGNGPTPFPGANPKKAPDRQQYGMQIVASSSSGGGLKDYGVFKDEVVYTVYIGMPGSDGSAPNWVLQYAKMNPPGEQPHVESLLAAPFPLQKKDPDLPKEVAARNTGRMIVVAGTISSDGLFNSLRVIQSPNPLLIQPTLDCLATWTFQPAEYGGKPVPVKVLLGIPIFAPPKSP